jgi:Astacin (Peptidase family M12A)
MKQKDYLTFHIGIMIAIFGIITLLTNCKKDIPVEPVEEIVYDVDSLSGDVPLVVEMYNPASIDRKTKIIEYTFPDNGVEQYIPVEVVDGNLIFEGDMILGHELETHDAGIAGINFRWKNATIPYTIVKSHPRYNDIKTAINNMNKNSILKLVPRNKEADYVNFEYNTNDCSSNVGRKGGKQIITIGISSRCPIGSIMHEIIHTAGMYHEQSRSDRDNFVQILLQNITIGKESQFQKIKNSVNSQGYDYGSIMHYHQYAFTKNGKPTILPKFSLPKGVVMGQRKSLSVRDIQGLKKLYNK